MPKINIHHSDSVSGIWGMDTSILLAAKLSQLNAFNAPFQFGPPLRPHKAD